MTQWRGENYPCPALVILGFPYCSFVTVLEWIIKIIFYYYISYTVGDSSCCFVTVLEWTIKILPLSFALYCIFPWWRSDAEKIILAQLWLCLEFLTAALLEWIIKKSLPLSLCISRMGDYLQTKWFLHNGMNYEVRTALCILKYCVHRRLSRFFLQVRLD